ncbi:MAG: argininosuccinate lyase [Deltaproteobacteria bacterium]|nr:argininosuccinate lyase [Deltaproteobacteria bacterium]
MSGTRKTGGRGAPTPKRQTGGAGADAAPAGSRDGRRFLTGSLAGGASPALAAVSVSIGHDRKLALHDLRGSRAHARMLAAVGLISPDELKAVEGGLDVLTRRAEAGNMVWNPALEDVHMNLERALTDLVGPAGAKIHTARSRNDQVALDVRLYLLETSEKIAAELGKLRLALVGKSVSAGAAPMPGYTHLQRAQPILLGHHLMAYYQMLSRDQQRLDDMRPRIMRMPLGSGALAGTGLPVDPGLVAAELGFERLSENSLDAVASRDHLLEFMSFAAILMVHLSRLAEDVVLWCSSEFAFAALPDSLCTTSSMMPQKKNPDGAELMRGKAGRVVGDLMTLLTVVKGLPLSYNRDLQEDKEPLFDAAQTLEAVLPLAAEIVLGLEFDFDRLREAADDPYVGATDLADHLVLQGVPFRQAHEQVGALVALAQREGLALRDVGPERLRKLCPKADPKILGRLSLEDLIEARSTSPGGTSTRTLAAQIEDAKADLAARFGGEAAGGDVFAARAARAAPAGARAQVPPKKTGGGRPSK